MNFVKTLCMDHFSRKLSKANLYKNHKLLRIIVTAAVPNVHPVISQTNNQDHVNNGLLVEQEYVHFNTQWILSKPLYHDSSLNCTQCHFKSVIKQAFASSRVRALHTNGAFCAKNQLQGTQSTENISKIRTLYAGFSMVSAWDSILWPCFLIIFFHCAMQRHL